MFYSVIICKNLEKTYTYKSDENINVGQIIKITLRSKICFGIVENFFQDFSQAQEYEIKDIVEVTPYTLSEIAMKFLKWISFYTVNNIGNIGALFINPPSLEDHESKVNLVKSDFHENYIELNKEQEAALQLICMDKFKISVLRGVTGSGKTMVYTKAALKAICKEKQVLIMIPEIALNEQLTEKLSQILGSKIYIWNSSISKAQKREIWKAVYSGELKLIVGTRSSIFLPFRNLGLIVVDEEHDDSYKQTTTPIYSAKHLAIMLSKLNNSPIILSSATVSLDIMKNIDKDDYTFIEINKRFGGSSLPDIKIISHDTFNEDILFSETINTISETLKQNKQVLIYLNRRGYSPITFCKNCKRKYVCPNCDIALVKHIQSNTYVCHYCNFFLPIKSLCVYCESENSLINFGFGVEKIYEYVLQKFSEKQIFIASSDTLNTKNKICHFIQMVKNKEVDIIIGTQIMAKGHHFKDLTLCVITDIDFSINSPDIRALEKTYQMVHQISGRAGREQTKGNVIIQTSISKPEIHNSLILADFLSFAKYELENRKLHKLPPYTRLVAVLVSGNQENRVIAAATALCRTSINKDIEILGPIPSPIARIKNKIRWRILLRSDKDLEIQKYIKGWINKAHIGKSVSIQVDVDPISLL